jgi:nicotinamidase-related amidase
MANIYRQFDADFSREVPAEGYGGWTRVPIEIAPAHTALAVMHAWNTGTRDAYPGWHRAVEYMPRAADICRTVFPPLLAAVRSSPLTVFHIVGGGTYYQAWPGYRLAADLAGPEPSAPEQVLSDPVLDELRHFRSTHVFPGEHNRADIARGFAEVDFPPEARPLAHEPIAENARQLFALCRDRGINHIIYAGFAINWCLLLSPGGMADMAKHGILCSTIRQAVTAVENRESARTEGHKEEALWRVALAYGFVFDLEDFLESLR